MSRFFVGQRVKLARGIDLTSRAVNYGWTGRINEFKTIPKGSCTPEGPLPIDCDCKVSWDQDTSYLQRSQNSAQLDPILPEGHRTCDEDFKRDLDLLLEGVQA